jgi:drug/metabolite transporter (DMT)-like permease
MLVLATLIWGVAFVVMKDAVDVLPPAWLIGVRFSLTGVLMAIIFHKSLKNTLNVPFLKASFVLGLATFMAFWVQTIGLTETTPGKNAFLTATYCVIVPFVMWALTKKRPGLLNVFAAVLCVAGIGLVSMTGGFFLLSFGDFMTLLCAFFFALQIIFVARYSKTFDVLALTVWQFIFGGALGIAIGLVSEPFPALSSFTPDFFFNLFYLVVFASAVCYVLQNVGLAHVAPTQGALLLSLESVFGVLSSIVLYGEVVTGRMVCGFVLIFLAILTSELGPTWLEEVKKRWAT